MIAAFLWSPLALLLVGTGDVRGYALAGAGFVSPAIALFLANRARRTGGLGVLLAAEFALLAVLIGVVAFGIAFAVLEGRPPTDGVAYAAVALLFLGLPMLVLGFLLALVWVALVRRLREDPRIS